MQDGDRARLWARVAGAARRRPVVAVLVSVVVTWVLVAGGTLLRVGMDLHAARHEVTAAIEALGTSELTQASDHFARGSRRAASAVTTLDQRHLAPLRALPLVGDDLDGARHLAVAVQETGRSASGLLAVAEDAVHVRPADGGAGPGVPVTELVGLQQPLERFASTLATQAGQLRASSCGDRVWPVGRACRQYLARVGSVLGKVERAATLLDVAPALLGDGQPRRYLMFAASYSELRGTIGLLGSWTIVTVDDGELEIGPFRPTRSLPIPREDVAAPTPDFAERYSDYGALRDWRNVNMSPHFPDVATVILELWERTDQPPVDGVVVASSRVIARMIDVVGPLEIPGVATLTPENVSEFIGLEAYGEFATTGGSRERKRTLGAAATLAFERLVELVDTEGPAAAAGLLDQVIEDGDLLVHATDAPVQQALEAVGVAGTAPSAQGPVTAVVVNNVAGNKVDYFTTRTVDVTAQVGRDGVVVTDVRVRFRNEAPVDGHPRHVLGPWTPMTEAGDNLSLVSLWCGPTCAFEDLPDGARVDASAEEDMPVSDTVVHLEPGTEREVRFRTVTRDAWAYEDGDLVVRLTHFTQPTAGETPLRVRLVTPEGFAPRQTPRGTRQEGGAIVWEGDGPRRLSIEVRYGKAR